jgi:hypothetical protein
MYEIKYYLEGVCVSRIYPKDLAHFFLMSQKISYLMKGYVSNNNNKNK